MREVIQIEIMKSEYVDNAFNIRIGDIKGSTEFSNIPKTGILEEISDEINSMFPEPSIKETEDKR